MNMTTEEKALDVITWDTCDIIDMQTEYMMEQAKEKGEELTEEQARDISSRDCDLFDYEWSYVCEGLSDILQIFNPESLPLLVTASNCGWRKRSGEMVLTDDAVDCGADFLRAVLPRTDCTFTIYHYADRIEIKNAHHDAPTGEWYTVTIKEEERECIIDSAAGIYIPQSFAKRFDLSLWQGISADDVKTLLTGPDEEYYWETWADVLDNATYTDERGTWRLDAGESGDLFVVLD